MYLYNNIGGGPGMNSAVRKHEKNKSSEKDEGTTVANIEKKNKPTGWPNFSEVFMISSLTGDGMSALMVC